MRRGHEAQTWVRIQGGRREQWGPPSGGTVGPSSLLFSFPSPFPLRLRCPVLWLLAGASGAVVRRPGEGAGLGGARTCQHPPHRFSIKTKEFKTTSRRNHIIIKYFNMF